MSIMTDLATVNTGDRVLLPLRLLVRSKLNHRSNRHRNDEADAELRASLKAQGVIENLSGYVDGERFAITAGGRRLAQLQKLATLGEIDDDYAVPCFVHAVDQSTDVSLSENIQRLPPHPADVFAAFAKLEKQGLDAEAIGNRYGKSEAEVRRFLRLGNVHPTIFKHFRSGAMEYNAVRAYAVTADRKEQLRVFEALGSDPEVPVWRIREQFQQSRLDTDSKLVKFVGLKAYRKAGGHTEIDLFSEHQQLLDVALLHELATHRIERQRTTLDMEGWKWVEVAFDGHVDWNAQRLTPASQDVPEADKAAIAAKESELAAMTHQLENDFDYDNDELSAQCDALEDEIATMEQALAERYPPSFTDGQKAHAGVQSFVEHNGRFHTVRGLLRAADARAMVKQEAAEHDGTACDKAVVTSDISQSLKTDLAITRNQSLQATLVAEASAARDLIEYQLCLATFLPYSYGGALHIRAEASLADTSLGDLADSPVMATMETARDKLSLGWVEADTDRARFEGFRALARRERNALLAYVAATTLVDGARADKDRAIAVFADESGWHVRKHWTPTGANYFNRLKRDQLMALGNEWYGDSFAEEHAKATKKALVERFDALFNGDGDRDENEREIRASWRPPELC